MFIRTVGITWRSDHSWLKCQWGGWFKWFVWRKLYQKIKTIIIEVRQKQYNIKVVAEINIKG